MPVMLFSEIRSGTHRSGKRTVENVVKKKILFVTYSCLSESSIAVGKLFWLFQFVSPGVNGEAKVSMELWIHKRN